MELREDGIKRSEKRGRSATRVGSEVSEASGVIKRSDRVE